MFKKKHICFEKLRTIKKTYLDKRITIKSLKSVSVLQICIASIILIAAIFILSVLGDMLGFLKFDSSQAEVKIKQGASTWEIADALGENGVVRYPFFYAIFVKISGDGGKEKYGNFIFLKNMSYYDINSALKKGPTYRLSPDEAWATIPEGYEARQIVDLLVAKGLGTKDSFLKAINQVDYDYEFVKNIPSGRTYRLEGYLMPDTYIFSKKEGEVSIITRMLDNFDKKVYSEIKDKIKAQNTTLDKIVILASIIEREAGIDSDRPIIASVFYNRLKSKAYPYLESCATVQYILGERKKVLSDADTKINNPYNTYINPGLPPGPISSPGTKSIDAAVNPATTDYYFFVATKDGSSLFAKTFDEHLKNVKKANN